MKTMHTAFSPILVCYRCGRARENMVEMVPMYIFCEDCLLEAMALLRHADSVTTELELNLVNE